MTLLLAFLSLLIERLVGYPAPLFRAVGHPVVWIGKLISLLDDEWNMDEQGFAARRMAGVAALAVVVCAAAATAWLAQMMLGWGGILGIAVTALLGSSLIAQKSLHDHVLAVARALEGGGLANGREAVSHIVGRDPGELDEAGVARAAIESLAENFSDGVTAPAFWLAIGGLPGIAAYKAVNTADSMIGHRSPRHAAFGWASARLDDLLNLPASRLSALLLVAAAHFVPGASPGDAWRCVRRDARRHRSPNAGWPEAAMAGALGLELAGPRIYGGVRVEDAAMGAGGRARGDAADIRRGLALFRVAATLLAALAGFLAACLLLSLHAWS